MDEADLFRGQVDGWSTGMLRLGVGSGAQVVSVSGVPWVCIMAQQHRRWWGNCELLGSAVPVGQIGIGESGSQAGS